MEQAMFREQGAAVLYVIFIPNITRENASRPCDPAGVTVHTGPCRCSVKRSRLPVVLAKK